MVAATAQYLLAASPLCHCPESAGCFAVMPLDIATVFVYFRTAWWIWSLFTKRIDGHFAAKFAEAPLSD